MLGVEQDSASSCRRGLVLASFGQGLLMGLNGAPLEDDSKPPARVVRRWMRGADWEEDAGEEIGATSLSAGHLLSESFSALRAL